MTNEEKLKLLYELDSILDSIFMGTHVWLHTKYLPSPKHVVTHQEHLPSVQHGVDGLISDDIVFKLGYRHYLALYHEHELVLQKNPTNIDKTKYILKYFSLDAFIDKMKEFNQKDRMFNELLETGEVIFGDVQIEEIYSFLTSICDEKTLIN